MNLRVSTDPFCGLCLAVPKFWKSVQKHNWYSNFRASLYNMQADAIRFNIAMFQFHGKCFCLLAKRGGILTDKYETGISSKINCDQIIAAKY